jgi:serine/threonine protein kinase
MLQDNDDVCAPRTRKAAGGASSSSAAAASTVLPQGAAAKSGRCILLDRSLEDLSPEQHLKMLKANVTVTSRVLKNAIAGRLMAPVSDSKEQLLMQYITALHGGDAGTKQPLHASSSQTSATSADLKAAKRSRSALSEDTPVKAKQSKTAGASKSVGKAAPAFKEGDVLELDRQKFRVGKPAGYGAMASLFYGTCLEGKHAGKQVMIKVQPRARNTIYQITTEHHVLTKLKQNNNAKLLCQEALAYGCHNENSYVLVTGLLGPDLLKVGNAEGRHSARNVLVIAEQALVLFEQLHKANFLHRDIKPDNLVLGCAGTPSARKLHIIDFGTCESLVDRNGARRTVAQAVEGSAPYMAVTVLYSFRKTRHIILHRPSQVG